jgi:hypothetical protein
VPAGTGSFTLVETAFTTTTLTATSNLITGSYSESATENGSTTVAQASSLESFSFTAHATDTVSNLTRTETGNSITGAFTRTVTETDVTTLSQSGTNPGGSFSLTETTSESPTTIETGNSVTGAYTLTENATSGYSFDETDTGSGGNWYSIHETGSSATVLTQSGNTVTGDYTQTVTANDNYLLTETGQITKPDGVWVYTDSLTATDSATTIEIGNSLNGQFQRTVTGSTNGTLIETGTDNGFEFELPGFVATGYAVSESGNLVDGSLSLSEAGTDRYGLLEQFNNTSNALAGNGPGNVDYSPTGAPFSIGQGPAAPTSGASYPGEQSPAAAEQDPFAQQGLELLHEYCFAGEAITGNSDGANWPIGNSEEIRPLDSRSDRDPQGPLVRTYIEKVYRNGKKAVMRIHFAGGYVRVTHNHPWYTKEKGWISSARLEAGDLLLNDKGGWVPIEGTEDLGEIAEVFNLRIAGTHTFHISNGNGCFVLVHNESPSTGAETLVMQADKSPYSAEDIAAAEKQIYTGTAAPSRFTRTDYVQGDADPTGKVLKLYHVRRGWFSDYEREYIGDYTRGSGDVSRNGETMRLPTVLHVATNSDSAYTPKNAQHWDAAFRPVEEVDIGGPGGGDYRTATMSAGGYGEIGESKRLVKPMVEAMAVHVAVAATIQYIAAPAGGKLIGFAAGKAGNAFSAVFKVGSGNGAKYVTKEFTEAESARVMQAIEKQLFGKDKFAAAEAKKALTELAGGNGTVALRAKNALSPRSFNSFDALKRELGSAGDGNVWHHIVEQRVPNVERFGAEAIHNTTNVVPISREANQAIANYYSSIPASGFTRGITVRDWLGTQSFSKQREFGLDILDRALAGKPLP